MAHRPIVPPGSAPPMAPYSPGVRAGNVVHVSGMLSLDAQGNVVGPGDIRVQTRQVLESIKAVVEAAGGTLADVAFTQIFLTNLDDYKAMNEVYRSFFPGNFPARYCIRADLVRPVFLVEIAATAYLGTRARKAHPARRRPPAAARKTVAKKATARKTVAKKAARRR